MRLFPGKSLEITSMHGEMQGISRRLGDFCKIEHVQPAAGKTSVFGKITRSTRNHKNTKNRKDQFGLEHRLLHIWAINYFDDSFLFSQLPKTDISPENIKGQLRAVAKIKWRRQNSVSSNVKKQRAQGLVFFLVAFVLLWLCVDFFSRLSRN